jgi:hypothetical protein
MYKCLFSGIALLLILCSCSAKKLAYNSTRLRSSTGKTFVFGQVIDTYGFPLPAAIIRGSNKGHKAQADKNGKYMLEITDHSKEIEAMWIGYLTYRTRGLRLIAGDSVHLDIKLMESKEVLID